MKFRLLYVALISIVSLFISGCGFEFIKDYPGESDETFYFETEDGWNLAIDHYYNKSTPYPKKTRTPIILCHGLGYNNHFWDLDKSVNFAKYLADNNYDVWVLSLRGSGKSTKPGISVIKNSMHYRNGEFKNASFQPSKLNWNIDHHIKFDIPSAIDFVIEKTGVSKITWIGHSLGGMIMYGYLGLNEPDKIQNFVAIGSPGIVPQPPNLILDMFQKNNILFKTFLIVNTRTTAKSITPFYRFMTTPDEVLFYNRDNIDVENIGKVLEFVVEDLPVGVVDQVLNMIKRRDFLSSDRSTNYTELLKKIDVPIMLCCGKSDNLAPPESVRYVYNNISSKDKKFRIFGVANGHKKDYGHNDLILGKNAKKEVYPEILAWLKTRTLLLK